MRGVAVTIGIAAVCLLTGCPEYGLNKHDSEPETPGDSDDDTGNDDTGEWVTYCPDHVFPGFEAPLNEACVVEAETGTFTPVIEWKRSGWTIHPDSSRVMSTPIVTSLTDDNADGDIDEFDTPDIVLVTFYEPEWQNSGVLRAVSGKDGTPIWSVVGAGLQGTGGVAAGDIDGDGVVELISLTPSGVRAFSHKGDVQWTSPDITGHIYGVSDVAAISDMDGDGKPEIIAGRAILNSDGSIRGTGSYGYGGPLTNVGSASFAVDVDGDGVQEVVAGNALYTPNGKTIWYNGQSPGYPAVANFDDDDAAEIVVSGDGRVRLDDSDGTVLWQATVPGTSNTYYVGPPTIADFDGDGEPEIGVAAMNVYAVYEGNGDILWTAATQDQSSGNTGSAVFDFEGDGAAEVVYADETRLWVFSGIDGSVKLNSTEHSNGTWLEYPVIADVDGDDHAEIVVPNTDHYSTHTGIYVFGDEDDSWQPGRRTWNQHAYHITNVDNDGGIPAHAERNWETFNNFRCGDADASYGLLGPDLVVAAGERCEIECDSGKLFVWAHIGNQGGSDIDEGVEIGLFAVIGGKEVLVDAVSETDTLQPAWYQDSVQFEVEGLDWSTVEALVVRTSSGVDQCDATNDFAVYPGPFCIGE